MASTGIMGQSIRIDGRFDDWPEETHVFTDVSGDSSGPDFENIYISSDREFIYIRFSTGIEMDLQEDYNLALYVDFDNDISTGHLINGIGAELRYYFSERYGILTNENGIEFVNHFPLGLFAAPTVTGTEFEISISRHISSNIGDFTTGSIISFRIEDNRFGGDEAPDDLTGITYELADTPHTLTPENPDRPASTGFRIMTFNVLKDRLFYEDTYNAYRRIFSAISPDIIALQEIYDHDAQSTEYLIQNMIGGIWYSAQAGPDIKVVSKYPITDVTWLDGNGAFFIDVDGRQIILINCHLPCCDNHVSRQKEVDRIMAFVRDVKSGDIPEAEEDAPIIILGDMNFVGKRQNPQTFITGDIVNNFLFGEDFAPDWDDTPLLDVDAPVLNHFTNNTWFDEDGSFLPGKLDWVILSDSKLSVEHSFVLYTPFMTPQSLYEYNLQKNDTKWASDHSPVVVDLSFGVTNTTESSQLELELSPNPASNKLCIHAPDPPGRIKIFDQRGKMIMNISNPPEMIDISSLSGGMYWLEITSNDNKIIKPFFKIR